MKGPSSESSNSRQDVHTKIKSGIDRALVSIQWCREMTRDIFKTRWIGTLLSLVVHRENWHVELAAYMKSKSLMTFVLLCKRHRMHTYIRMHNCFGQPFAFDKRRESSSWGEATMWLKKRILTTTERVKVTTEANEKSRTSLSSWFVLKKNYYA